MTAGRPLLETKLYLPEWRAGQVSRPRLLARIHWEHKLTLVSASAGFGKTTLLAEWAASAPTGRVAWLSLDPNDNDPALFWSYLIAALQKIHPQLGERSHALLNSPQPPPIESILVTLLNEINAVEEPLALVLDDYHVIENPAINRGIDFLLSHLPPQLHLIVASRSDPPWPLARLRARGTLNELRSADLRFTSQEAAAFLNQAMNLNISAADVAALEQRTEGWIAGLQLAALSMQGREDVSGFIAAFSGDDRYIVDYLLEEVLQCQSDRIRSFLLQTAILDRLSAPLCHAVCDATTDPADSQNLLIELERSNLFVVSLDNKRQWYRYHHLFADVLQARARAEQPKCLLSLHSRASEWYEQQAFMSEAIHHALAAQDFERSANLIEQAWPTMRQRQQEATVLNWLKALPEVLIRKRPALSVAYALALLNTGQLDAVETRLQDAEQALSSSSVNEAQYQALPGSIANARAFLAQAQGDFDSAVTYAQQALEQLPSEEENERGVTAAFLGLAYWANGDVKAARASFSEALNIFQKLGGLQIVISATLGLANMEMAQGWLQTAVTTCEQALQLAAQQPVPILRGVADVHLALSQIRYEQGDLVAASQLLQKAEALREQGSISGTDYLWWLIKAQLTAAKGDLDTALSQLQESARLYRRSPIPNIHPVEALKVRWWLQQGRLVEALDWVQTRGLSVNDLSSYLHEYEHLTLARVLIAQYRQSGTEEVMQQTIDLLTHLLAAAEAKERTGSTIKILVVLALAHEAQGSISTAIPWLERALNLAEPERHVRIFAEHGTPMVTLLKAAKKCDLTPTYTQQLLTASATWGKSQETSQNHPPPASVVSSVISTQQSGIEPPIEPLVEPLSQRELEVLRLLNTELSGPEIARELIVALSTVRTHTKRIYSKLNVTNRRAAVKRATELGLI